MRKNKEDNEDVQAYNESLDAYPTEIQTKWQGLLPEESYSVSLIDNDLADCSGATIAPSFLSGLTDGQKMDMTIAEMSLRGDEKVIGKYLQLSDSMGTQAACCKIELLEDRFKGSSRRMRCGGERKCRREIRKELEALKQQNALGDGGLGEEDEQDEVEPENGKFKNDRNGRKNKRDRKNKKTRNNDDEEELVVVDTSDWAKVPKEKKPENWSRKSDKRNLKKENVKGVNNKKQQKKNKNLE